MAEAQELTVEQIARSIFAGDIQAKEIYFRKDGTYTTNAKAKGEKDITIIKREEVIKPVERKKSKNEKTK